MKSSQKIKKFLNNTILESDIPHKQPIPTNIINSTIDRPFLLSWSKVLSTLDSCLNIKLKAKIAAKSIKILYKYFWIPHSTTANISPSHGIK